jgi:Kef-type K+ transport system membrane component KefB
VTFASFAIYLGVALSITAFPVLARILAYTRLQHPRLGTLVLASAAVQDLLAWLLLAAVLATLAGTASMPVAGVLGSLVLYAMVMPLMARPLLHQLTSRLTRDRRASPYLIPVIGTGLFLSAAATSMIGVHEIIGAFAFGLIMPREPRGQLARLVREPFEVGTGLLLPIFFVVTGLSVDVGALGGTELLELVLITCAACTGKLLGAAVPARLCGMSWRDSYSVGLLMNTRGLTELVILNIGVSAGVLDSTMFTMMVIMALTTTAMAGPLLPRSLIQELAQVTRSEPGGSDVKKSTVAA